MSINETSQQLIDSLKLQAESFGQEMKGDNQEIVLYLNQRLPLVAMAISEPGFMEILEVESNNLLLKASLLAVDRADSIDSRLKDMLMGAMQMALRAAAA